MNQSTKFKPLLGGCACGEVRFALNAPPMFVHCCHCTRCQRETGGPFAHHAMIEWTQFEVLQSQPHWHKVPTDSGGAHWVARCGQCNTVMWNSHGSRSAAMLYVRVGTLDEPGQLGPQAHIYVRSKQPWLTLDDHVPHFSAYYNRQKAWPAQSVERYEQAKQQRKEQKQ